MTGPKMSKRPADFEEDVVRKAPTFLKWVALEVGQKLRYACRDFFKGNDNDEERLMRRIMIARRNNLRDHDILKRARVQSIKADILSLSSPLQQIAQVKVEDREEVTHAPESIVENPPIKKRKRKSSFSLTDSEVLKDMDIPAVEATRSYKAWLQLPDNKIFTYNQRYIKGKEGHEWLLKKNIWRRMRYRRENKKLVEKLKDESNCATLKMNESDQKIFNNISVEVATTRFIGQTLSASSENRNSLDVAVAEAAVAAVTAGEPYVQEEVFGHKSKLVNTIETNTLGITIPSLTKVKQESDQIICVADINHHDATNPLVVPNSSMLHAAAKLAEAASGVETPNNGTTEKHNNLVQV